MDNRMKAVITALFSLVAIIDAYLAGANDNMVWLVAAGLFWIGAGVMLWDMVKPAPAAD